MSLIVSRFPCWCFSILFEFFFSKVVARLLRWLHAQRPIRCIYYTLPAPPVYDTFTCYALHLYHMLHYTLYIFYIFKSAYIIYILYWCNVHCSLCIHCIQMLYTGDIWIALLASWPSYKSSTVLHWTSFMGSVSKSENEENWIKLAANFELRVKAFGKKFSSDPREVRSQIHRKMSEAI